jgi:hypothetical protein
MDDLPGKGASGGGGESFAQHFLDFVGFRSSSQPTYFCTFELSLAVLASFLYSALFLGAGQWGIYEL